MLAHGFTRDGARSRGEGSPKGATGTTQCTMFSLILKRASASRLSSD
jgi:hypothetical protein